MNSDQKIKLPSNLRDGMDLANLNRRLRSGDASLDWSAVETVEEKDLDALLGGLDLSDDADVLGLEGKIANPIAEILSRYFEGKEKQPVTAKKKSRTGIQPAVWSANVDEETVESDTDTVDLTQVLSESTGLNTFGNKSLAESVPSAYDIRTKLESAIVNDLLGPAGGAEEEVFEQNVTDRYLVGMLAPKQTTFEVQESDDDYALAGDDTAQDGKVETDVPIAQTMFPSSMGMTFSVRGDVKQFIVSCVWGQYDRVRSRTVIQKEGRGELCWRRTPIKSSTVITLDEGPIEPWIIDPKYDEVYVQGITRKQGDDWIVTLFMVNSRLALKKGRDAAWVFQPELTVESSDASDPDIFVCRPQ